MSGRRSRVNLGFAARFHATRTGESSSDPSPRGAIAEGSADEGAADEDDASGVRDVREPVREDRLCRDVGVGVGAGAGVWGSNPSLRAILAKAGASGNALTAAMTSGEIRASAARSYAGALL